MKKSILFSLGLLLITASAIPFSLASRNAYHAYITSEVQKVDHRYYSEYNRRTSNRTTPTKSGYRFRSQLNSRLTHSRPKGLSRVSATNTTYIERTSRTAVDTKLRPFATRAGVAPWRQTLRGAGRVARISSVSLPNKMMSFETFVNDSFSVSLPVVAQAKPNNAHAFVMEGAEISLKRFEASTCHKAFGFRGCATNIMRVQNNLLVKGKGRLIALNRVVREAYRSDVFLDRSNVQTNIYTEKFTAKFMDGIVYTLYRYAVQDVDGGVYFIEVKVPRSQARKFVSVANTIFDSFRIYATE